MSDAHEELPPTKPSAEEAEMLTRLYQLDERLRQAGRHLGHAPGDGLCAGIEALLRRHGISDG